ncbi:NAD-binding protein, partial [Streptococcus pyogenes]
EAKHAVVIGSSFIGMEAAASLAGGHEVQVTVISRDKVPFQKTLGEDIGRMLLTEHEEHGIIFKAEQEVEKFEGKEGKL